jgi:hypothetical protein
VRIIEVRPWLAGCRHSRLVVAKRPVSVKSETRLRAMLRRRTILTTPWTAGNERQEDEPDMSHGGS